MLRGELHLSFSQVHWSLLRVPKCHQYGRSYHKTCPYNWFIWFYRYFRYTIHAKNVLKLKNFKCTLHVLSRPTLQCHASFLTFISLKKLMLEIHSKYYGTHTKHFEFGLFTFHFDVTLLLHQKCLSGVMIKREEPKHRQWMRVKPEVYCSEDESSREQQEMDKQGRVPGS